MLLLRLRSIQPACDLPGNTGRKVARCLGRHDPTKPEAKGLRSRQRIDEGYARIEGARFIDLKRERDLDGPRRTSRLRKEGRSNRTHGICSLSIIKLRTCPLTPILHIHFNRYSDLTLALETPRSLTRNGASVVFMKECYGVAEMQRRQFESEIAI